MNRVIYEISPAVLGISIFTFWLSVLLSIKVLLYLIVVPLIIIIWILLTAKNRYKDK